MPKRLAVLGILLLCAPAFAEDFGPRFKKGYGELRAGNPEEALASFNELLTETPDSELVRYSIAAAEYSKGIKDLGAGAAEDGVKGLIKARGDFQALAGAETPFVREEAEFAAANCSAQIAKQYSETDKYNERLQALQDAVSGYESVLEHKPKHEAAATNLNHTRYLLKKMLQNPPKNQQKSKDDKGDQGDQGQQDQPGDQGQQPQDQQQNQDQKSEDQGDQQDQDKQQQETKSTGQKTKEDANIEAILDSLEDKNREEQKNLRKAKGAPKVVNGKWW